MEFRHLRYFVVLADELHFGRAARRLAISQPPLSLDIQRLEGSLGVAQFERDSKGAKLTLAGVAFREAALRLLAETVHARDIVQQVARGVLSRVRIGFAGSMLRCRAAQRGVARLERDGHCAGASRID